MADLSNNSFIPKQNPTKVRRQTATQKVFFLTLVSYVLIIAALIASAAVFFYDRFTQKTLADEIAGLNNDVANFKQSDMDVVVELDERLLTTKKVIEDNISIPAILSLLELHTIASMQFLSTTITREEGDVISLKGEVKTDSFDSVLFQREIYSKAATLTGIELTDVTIALGSVDAIEGPSEDSVSLAATFKVATKDVLYRPVTATTSPLTVPTAPIATTTTPGPVAASSTSETAPPVPRPNPPSSN